MESRQEPIPMLVSQSPSGFVMDFMQGFEIGYELQYDTKPIIVRPVANAVPGTFLPGRCHPQRALPPIAPGALPKPKHGREVNPVGPTRTNEQAPQTTKFRCVVTLRPQLMYMPSSQACKEMFFSARRELKRGKTAITPVHKDISATITIFWDCQNRRLRGFHSLPAANAVRLQFDA